MKLVLFCLLTFSTVNSFAQQVYTRVWNYGYYAELEIVNRSPDAVTCQGQVTWRYRSSTSDSYKGIYKYLQPGQVYREAITLSPNLRLLFIRPDINCN